MELELKEEKDILLDVLIGYRGKIYFGVPEETNTNRGQINNATLLAIHEHGSPINNLPKRELLKPTLMKHENEIKEAFNKVFDYLIVGDKESADREMDKLAQRVEMWGKQYFVDNEWEPDKPATIRAKNRRHGLPPDAKTTTLIDTGELRRSIRGIFVKK